MLVRLLRGIWHRRRAAGAQSAQQLCDEGNRLAAAGAHERAAALYERALAADPRLAVAHSNRALSLTALGRLGEAWEEAEWRLALQTKTREFIARVPIARWRGEPLAGTLLVLWEQGLGDMIQHLRFLGLAAARAGRAAFLSPPKLAGLARASFPQVEVLAVEHAPPDWSRFAAYVPLLSLPLALRLEPKVLPAAPYLCVPPGVAPRAAPRARPAVGIVWRSGPDEPGRDCPLPLMLALAAPGLSLVSLQFEPTARERAQLAAAGVPEGAGDFLETAALAMQLDAVVSVDTSALHLAAALGRPTKGLLNEPASVRWMIGRRDSPWYPSLSLYRKRPTEPWEGLIGEVARDLRAELHAAS